MSYRYFILLFVDFLLSSFKVGEKPDRNSLVEFGITKRIQRSLDVYKAEVRQYGHIIIAIRNIPAKFYLPNQVEGLPIIYKSHDDICEEVGKSGIERDRLIINKYKKTAKDEAFLFIDNWRFNLAPANSPHSCQIDIGPLECGGTGSIKRKYRNLTPNTYYMWDESRGWKEGGLDYIFSDKKESPK